MQLLTITKLSKIDSTPAAVSPKGLRPPPFSTGCFRSHVIQIIVSHYFTITYDVNVLTLVPGVNPFFFFWSAAIYCRFSYSNRSGDNSPPSKALSPGCFRPPLLSYI